MTDVKNANSDEQRQRFIKTARALGADEDEAAFRAKLAVIARQKPVAEPEAAQPVKGKQSSKPKE